MRFFRLLCGVHYEKRKKFVAGDIIPFKGDLCKAFNRPGSDRFVEVPEDQLPADFKASIEAENAEPEAGATDNFESFSLKNLRKIATKNGITFEESDTKEDLITTLRIAGKTE